MTIIADLKSVEFGFRNFSFNDNKARYKPITPIKGIVMYLRESTLNSGLPSTNIIAVAPAKIINARKGTLSGRILESKSIAIPA
ncbi:MAG: hypothetical protein NTX52_05135 [Planctomycetota bacterium]|nr:hypothetical protein [Planctomycetota bacterium]